jgi:hypothetical protein
MKWGSSLNNHINHKEHFNKNQNKEESLSIIFSIKMIPKPVMFLIISFKNQLKVKRIRLKNEFSKISKKN